MNRPVLDTQYKALHLLATTFRTALEAMGREGFKHIELTLAASFIYGRFPSGCCDDASILLAKYLDSEDYQEVSLIAGSDGGDNQELPSHVWLVVDGFIVDITADQFNSEGYTLAPVIVTQHSDFHASFKQIDKGRALETFRAIDKQKEFSKAYQALVEASHQP